MPCFYSGDFKAYIVFKKVNRKEQNWESGRSFCL